MKVKLGHKKIAGILLAGAILLCDPAAFAQSTWKDLSGNWNTSGNWTPGTVPNSVNATATLSSIITQNRTVTVDTNVTLGTLNITSDKNYTVSQTGGTARTMTFNATGPGPAFINVSGAGSPTITGSKLSLSLADPTVITNTGTGIFTIASTIGGAGSLTHNGTGTTLLSGANTFSGGLTINSGKVQFGNNSANGAGTFTINGGAIEASGGARTLNDPVTVGGNFGVSGANDLTLSGNMGLGSSTRTVTVTNTGLTTFGGVVSGSGGLTKDGSQALLLGGVNTYTGPTTVSAGTLRAGAAGTAFGNNSAMTLANVSGATLDLANFSNSVGSLSGGGVAGGNILLGTATLTTGANNSPTSYAGVISGTGGLTKTGGGTQTLGGANTYTGVTTVSGGVLSVSNLANGGSNSNIGASNNTASNLVLDNGTLAYTGAGSSTDRLFTIGAGGATIAASGTGALNFTGTGSLASTGSGARTLTLTGTSTATNNLSGDLADGTGGVSSLVKDGTGTWMVSGDNTFTGSTTVKNGVLLLNSNTINGAVPGALVVGDGIGAANSAVARNMQEGQIGNTSTVTVYSDGWFDVNATVYPDRSYPPMKDETIGQVNLYGGHITTGAGGSLNLSADLTSAGISSFSSTQTALIDATGGQLALNGSRTINVESGTQPTALEVRGAIVNQDDIIGGTVTSGVTKTGAGKLSYTGTEANTYTGATVVNGGTLELAKSGGVASIAGSAVTVNSGGTLLLSSSEQINNSATLALNSGTLATSDIAGIETLGTLTLSGTSTIDLGTAVYLLKFANSSALSSIWTGSLTIYGWAGIPSTSGTANQIYFGNNASGLTSSQLGMISFNGFGPGSMLLTSGELVPMAVPETGTLVGALLIVLLVLHREIRPLFAACRRWMASRAGSRLTC